MVTEKPDGLYDEILKHAPRLENNVRRLREEHPEIVPADRRDDRPPGAGRDRRRDVAPRKPRDDLQRFMGSVMRPRQRGADLVWEAYNVDIGGIE